MVISPKFDLPDEQFFSQQAKRMMENGIEDAEFELNQMIAAAQSVESLNEMIRLRCENHKPLQYLLGEWDFFDMTLSLGEGVLIPRADTEFVVETAEQLGQFETITDLCSGSGCIALRLARVNPKSTVLAVELSEEALPYLKKNIEKYGQGRVHCVAADVLGFENQLEDGSQDLIISNPPYISRSVQNDLMPEVKQEPEMALFAPDNGLLFYEYIIPHYKRKLKSGGALVFEIGYDQKDAVVDMMKKHGYQGVKSAKDYGNNDRVVWGFAP